MVVLKELIFTVSSVAGCGGPGRTFNNFHIGQIWCLESFLSVFTMGGCGGLIRTDFQQFPLW